MICDRVICGIDGSPASLVAAQHSGALAPAELSLIAAVSPWDEVLEPAHQHADEPTLHDQAKRWLRDARSALPDGSPARTEVLSGRPQDVLIDAARRTDATLVVVGSHGQSRARGVVLGSVATTLLHDAPCPVLISRGSSPTHDFPTVIAVGVDGSAASGVAYATARALCERRAAAIRVVTASVGSDPDRAAALTGDDAPNIVYGDAVEALVEISREVDLVVVGSRGLRGIASLGSVSERVAHEARSSVLVIRTESTVDERSGEGPNR
jgi:nucleotide-binding universal stress UspA family protein